MTATITTSTTTATATESAQNIGIVGLGLTSLDLYDSAE